MAQLFGLKRESSRRRPQGLTSTRIAQASAPQHPSFIDVWLQRVSHIVQLGLFLLTLATIYFTVIPLYQKALLDEQIAEKELRLAKLEKSLDAAYRKIRASAVRSRGQSTFSAGTGSLGRKDV